jgi:hypothetical protein
MVDWDMLKCALGLHRWSKKLHGVQICLRDCCDEARFNGPAADRRRQELKDDLTDEWWARYEGEWKEPDDRECQ